MAKFARGSARQLTYIKEVTGGVTPPTPAMTTLRNTGDSFNLTRDSYQSEELRSDRAITDLTLGNKQTTGNIDIELSFENFEPFMEAALFSADTLTVANDSIKNGVTLNQFSIEKGFADVPFYQVFSGMAVNTFTLNLQGNSPVTAAIDFMGTGYTQGTTTLDPAPIDAVQGGLFDSYTGEIKEGGVTVADVMSLTLSINNNLTPAFVLFNENVAEIIDGRCNVEGTVQLYFQDSTIYNKFANDTESSLEFTLKSNATDGYTFKLPRIKYTSADLPVSDEGPVTVSMPFQALQDDTPGVESTIEIIKLAVI
jgi:hypothetical protein